AALNQVLSLIKATLAQVDDASGISPVVQVHNETRTLIVKGTSSQLRAVEDALSALNPNRDRTAHHGLFDSADPLAGGNAAQMQNSQTAEQAANNNNEVRQLKDKLNSVEARLRKVQNAAADREAEIARLKAALGEKPKGATQGGAKE
ncbi:MAG: hypothetical protein JWN51_2914, partial [Phycisphaerales bacterium]|nr:hypothetical protein [Phycisphaerales bacterium]